MHVECLGNSYGFPHGPDNDMKLVLSNLFLEQRQPRDNSVHCTAYELLRMLGRTDSWALRAGRNGQKCNCYNCRGSRKEQRHSQRRREQRQWRKEHTQDGDQ